MYKVSGVILLGIHARCRQSFLSSGIEPCTGEQGIRAI